MKQQARQWPQMGPRRVLLMVLAAFLVFLASRFFNGDLNGNGRRSGAASGASAYATDPTVLCADGSRSSILTRAAQEDACAAHGGIRRLLVPPYRAGRQPAPSSSPRLSQPRPSQPQRLQPTEPVKRRAGGQEGRGREADRIKAPEETGGAPSRVRATPLPTPFPP